MHVIDVEETRGVAHRMHYIAAQRCPQCGALLEYQEQDRHTLPGGEAVTVVWLQCPACQAPPVDELAIPVRGNDEETIEENLSMEFYMLAPLTVAV